MTEYTTPINSVFEFQRTAIEQSQHAVERSVEFQQSVNEAVLDGLDSQESAQRQGVELNRTAVHSYLDAIEATVPGAAGTFDDVREVVDEQYDTLLENHTEAFDSVAEEVERGIEVYDESAEEYLAAVEEQTEALLEAHEEIEGETVDVVREATGQLEEFQDQLEEQVEEVQEQVEEVQEQVAESAQLEA